MGKVGLSVGLGREAWEGLGGTTDSPSLCWLPRGRRSSSPQTQRESQRCQSSQGAGLEPGGNPGLGSVGPWQRRRVLLKDGQRGLRFPGNGEGAGQLWCPHAHPSHGPGKSPGPPSTTAHIHPAPASFCLRNGGCPRRTGDSSFVRGDQDSGCASRTSPSLRGRPLRTDFQRSCVQAPASHSARVPIPPQPPPGSHAASQVLRLPGQEG